MATQVSYVPLEANNLSSLGVAAPTFKPGDTTPFFATSSFLYTLCFTAIVIAAFYRYTVAGILRMQASEAAIRKSNEIIRNVTLGLLGVFSLFLILFTVNKDLVRGDIDLRAVLVGGSGGGGSFPTNTVTTGYSRGSPTNASMQAAINEDAVIRQDLLASNIGVNKPVCPNPSSSNCTTVGGLPAGTIAMLKNVRSSCPTGPFILSGGTEAGHSSHGPGKYPVDISINQSSSQVESCIRSFTPSSRKPKNASGGELCYPGKVYERFGFVFCDEQGGDRPWHVYKPE